MLGNAIISVVCVIARLLFLLIQLLQESPLAGVGQDDERDKSDALKDARADPIHTIKELHRCLATQGWLLSQTLSTVVRRAFPRPDALSFWSSNSFWNYTLADQNRFLNYPVRFQANRLKNFFPSERHRAHQLKVAGRVPGGVAI